VTSIKFCELCGNQSMPPEQSKCTCTHDDCLFVPRHPQLARKSESAAGDALDAARFRFLDGRFAATKTSASQRVIDDLRLGEGADPTDSLADIVDVAMLNS
jgi:hypothetical protein